MCGVANQTIVDTNRDKCGSHHLTTFTYTVHMFLVFASKSYAIGNITQNPAQRAPQAHAVNKPPHCTFLYLYRIEIFECNNWIFTILWINMHHVIFFRCKLKKNWLTWDVSRCGPERTVITATHSAGSDADMTRVITLSISGTMRWDRLIKLVVLMK